MKKRVSNYLKTLLISCLLVVVTISKAQNIGINVTGATPNAKAMLDIDATGMATKGGLLIPRLTTVERNAITAPIPMSLLIYNTTTNCFEAWNQTANSWIAFGCITCATPTAPAATAATANTSNSFIANWAAVTGATNYFLDVATNASFSSFVSGYNNINIGNSTAASITNLTCNTTYYYRVRAANTCTSSVSASSNTITVITPACSGGGGGGGCNDTATVACGTQRITRKNVNIGVQLFALQGPANNGIFEKHCYANIPENCELYGGLYSWNEAMNYNSGVTCDPCGSSGVQGVCPSGFHIPTYLEMARYLYCVESTFDPATPLTLADFQAGANIPSTAGNHMKYVPTDSWHTPNYYWPSGAGDNLSGFSAHPQGSGDFFGNSFSPTLYFWTSTDNTITDGMSFYIYDDGIGAVQLASNSRNNAFFIRCMKD